MVPTWLLSVDIDSGPLGGGVPILSSTRVLPVDPVGCNVGL